MRSRNFGIRVCLIALALTCTVVGAAGAAVSKKPSGRPPVLGQEIPAYDLQRWSSYSDYLIHLRETADYWIAQALKKRKEGINNKQDQDEMMRCQREGSRWGKAYNEAVRRRKDYEQARTRRTNVHAAPVHGDRSDGDELADGIVQFTGEFRSQRPGLPEDAAQAGIVAGVMALLDGKSVREAVAAAIAAAERQLSLVKYDDARGTVTIQTPTATPGTRILSGANALNWLIKHGFVTSDGKPLPQFNDLRSEMLSTGASSHDSLLVIGGDWDLRNQDAPLGRVTIIVREPVAPEQDPPRREETPQPAGPDVVRLSRAEIEHIVNWGVKHNRSPEDIQKDLNEANETAGGSGEVPRGVDSVETPLGPVTAPTRDIRKYQELVRQIEKNRQEIVEFQEEGRELNNREQTWIAFKEAWFFRMLTGLDDLVSENDKVKEKLAAIDKKYGEPDLWDHVDSVAWRRAYEAWLKTPEAQGKVSPAHTDEINQAWSDYVDIVQDKTTSTPSKVEGTSWLNRHIVKLNQIRLEQRVNNEAIDLRRAELRTLHQARNKFEQRALR